MRALPVLALLLISWLAAAQEAPPTFVLPPAEDIVLIDDFTAASAAAWTAKMGANVTCEIEAGYAIPGVAQSLMRLRGGIKDPDNHEPGANWFSVTKEKLKPRLPAETTGLRIMLGEQVPAQWWVQVALRTDEGANYACVISDQSYPAGRIVELLVPLERIGSLLRDAYGCTWLASLDPFGRRYEAVAGARPGSVGVSRPAKKASGGSSANRQTSWDAA